MKLNIQERLMLVQTLPEKGNFETMEILETLKKLLYPSEKEVKAFDVKQLNDSISWNKAGVEGVELKLTEGQNDFIINLFNNLDKQEELTLLHYSIFKKFKKLVK